MASDYLTSSADCAKQDLTVEASNVQGTFAQPQVSTTINQSSQKPSTGFGNVTAPNPNSPSKPIGPGNSKGLTTFTLFAKLPAELRLMIWEEAANQPRVVVMDMKTPYIVRTEIPTPAFFHVSYEAREAAEKVFKIKKSKPGFQPLPAILINFQVDIPLISGDILRNTHRLTAAGREMFGKFR